MNNFTEKDGQVPTKPNNNEVPSSILDDKDSSTMYSMESQPEPFQWNGHGQYFLAEISTTPSLHNEHMNLMKLLEKADPSKPVLYAPGFEPITYGSLLTFIRNGGSLAHIGVHQG
eukprot:CAMPEP_0116542296 /NCGR_PEP_ID=MMETSP0397-20121206/940_1 /TAXON_ID=216820 /ORGANISM="Cyclophora tenuis, Strain ECT3854" /LENGTH=114 /DNA_ID=CAMNT_0004066295 /DNA_START=655 /DNA_END=995 /DNA_ORIENTATION=+